VACFRTRSNLDEQIKELKRLLKPSGTNRSGSILNPSMQNITALLKLMTCRSILALFKKSDKNTFEECN
jgi:ubiquinone/menaquinone biosynthesis C-methylase UbiE